jgi:hypothetical protein
MRLIGGLALGALLAGLATVSAQDADLCATPEEYGRLCREVSAVCGRSVEEIRSCLPALAGKHVEIRGKVLGKAHGDLVSSGLVDMYLKCGEDSCFVACPPDLSGMQPGRCVRLLVQVPADASDIDDCVLKAVAEDLLAYEREQPTPREDGEKRLEIGEAAYGVRDQAPVTGAAQPALPSLPSVGPAAPPQEPPGGGPNGALPPELRGLQSLSGATPPQPKPPAAGVPQVQFTAGAGRTYEQVVKIWTDWVRKYNSSLTPQQADLIVRWTLYHSAKSQVDHRLVFSVMKYESDFNPRCVSHAGAMGLMQLMPCNVTDFKVRDPYDVAENIRGGVEHLAEFLRKYQGKSYYEQTVLSLACYNAGPGAVAKYGGVPPYAETQSYVKKVPALFAQLVKDGYP